MVTRISKLIIETVESVPPPIKNKRNSMATKNVMVSPKPFLSARVQCSYIKLYPRSHEIQNKTKSQDSARFAVELQT